MVKLLSFGIEPADSICVLVDEADFISQVAPLVHDRECFPLAGLDVYLLNVGTKSGAEATSEDDHLVRLRAEASAVGKRELELDFEG